MRVMSSAMLAAIQSGYIQPALFVQVQFATSTAYLWSGRGSIAWNGQTWTGVGSLGGVSVIEEGATVEAKGITLTLSGFDSTLLADVLQEFRLGLPALVYLGLFDGLGSLIATPITCWAGRTDQPTIVDDGQTSTISINCENRLLEMNVACDRRYTHDDQQIDFPGDLGFQFVNSLQDQTIYWGQTPSSSNNV